MTKQKLKVWDAPTRLFHWLLVLALAFMWYSGETTYWPMEMAVLEIGCIQGKRKPGPGCVSIKGSQLAAALQCNWATRMSQKAASAGG